MNPDQGNTLSDIGQVLSGNKDLKFQISLDEKNAVVVFTVLFLSLCAAGLVILLLTKLFFS